MATLQLFNTLTGAQEEFQPLEAGKVKLYVCGPTVYDAAHLGHARCYITWDVLVRFLKFLGYEVTYVRNVTDVDDKILNKAAETGKTPGQVAEENYISFTEDMRALNTLPPDREPRATKSIPMMIEAIQSLIDKNAAYVAPDGTVYFRVAAKSNYGALSKKPLDDLKAGARVEVDPHKESPLDFALWKAVDEADRTDEKLKDGYCFESPWGRGRPGWHIECSAMNFEEFGTPRIDIHAGGADLIFPHHENEIAQSEMWHGLHGGPEKAHENDRFSKVWLHNGFVNVSGEKMSKSLGNFSTVKKVLERYDANTIRRFLLNNGYRMPVDFNDEALEGAARSVERIHGQLQDACTRLGINKKQLLSLEMSHSYFAKHKSYLIDEDTTARVDFLPLQLSIDHLEEDLNTSQAVSFLHSLIGTLGQIGRIFDEDPNRIIRDTNLTATEYLRELLQHTITLFCLLGFSVDPVFPEMTFSVELLKNIEALIISRKKAKVEKNWAEADALRDQITHQGLKILDNKDGTTSVEKDGVEIVRV